ncbi:MAG: PAS domain S-box protein [FCB group bacterium]|nr:PAS domain S-box protein [FCB group bacterium]
MDNGISLDELRRLREAEEKYRKMMQMANDAIFGIDTDSAEIVEVNQRAIEMTGMQENELLSLKAWEIHPPEEKDLARELFDQVVATGQGHVSRLHFLRPDDSVMPVEVSSSLITFGSGRIIQRICRDCTPRVLMEDKKRQFQQFFEHILDLMPVGLGVRKNINRTPEIVFENVRLKEMFHENGDDGHHIHWNDCECLADCETREILEANGCYGVERNLPDGRVLMFTSSYYRDPENNWHEIQVVQDISERRGLEIELKQSNEDLEDRVDERTRELREKQTQLIQSEKMASLGQLVAGVAHEVNTPIGALKSNNDLFVRSMTKITNFLFDQGMPDIIRDDEQLRKMFSSMTTLHDVNSEAVARIVRIVDSLRLFARLDRAEMDLVDIHEGLESTLTLVHHTFKNRIEVVKNFGRLPRINCYPNQINQVFMNLLVNAGHAIEDKGTVTITTTLSNDKMMIEIRDTGDGIRAEHLKRIFDPGFTTKGPGVGTGLGLSIAHQIIADHGGKIEVESEPGRGTAFKIYLPLAEMN